ncbi:MAG: GMC family oxidoreductase [Rubripirellula sp.]
MKYAIEPADLIVVGAGSAGCILATRLADRGVRVLLVEPPSGEAPKIDRQRPARWLNLLGSGEDWSFSTEANSRLANRRLTWPRGKGLGGSSRINSMIWFPPTANDLAMLVDASGGSWNERDLQLAYQSARDMVDPESPRWLSDASKQFMKAARELEDAQPMIYDRVNRQGRRWNPASLLSSLPPAASVQIVRATVDRILWDNDRAIGIRVSDESSSSDLMASQGVVLCAGTIASPAILMRSGVGAKDELRRHQIDVRVQRDLVGKQLQDHLIMPVIFETESKMKFDAAATAQDIARWQIVGRGPLSSNIAECGGLFSKSRVQIHVTPTHYLSYPKPSVASVMTLGVNLTQPQSRGSVTLGDAGLLSSPLIETGYFENDLDAQEMIRAVSLARSIASQTSLSTWIKKELLPGSKRSGDAAIAKSIARYAQTLYHPVGTNAISDQLDSVITPGFAVRGTERLWSVDAGVLPQLTMGNPNATVMTLAVLASDQVADGLDG